MDRRNRRKIIKEVSNRFNLIYETSKKVCKPWETNVIPLDAINNIIDLTKYTDENLSKGDANAEHLKRIIETHNAVCESLKKTFAKKASEMNLKGVSLEYVKYCIDEVIRLYKSEIIGEKTQS